MPIEWSRPTVEQSMQLGFEAFVPEIEEEEKPSTLDLAAATLRIENPVSSWVESLRFRSDEADVEGYDPYADLPDEYLPYSKEFLDVNSPAQREMKMAQIDSQIRDRQIMAQGGLKTVGWTLVAGLGDPVNLPLMALPASMAIKAGAGFARAGGITAAGGAAEVLVSEAILHETQPTRTWQETMYAMGGTTLLGGTLGGLAGAGTKATIKALDDADKEIADIIENGGTIDPSKGQSVNAMQRIGTLEEEGTGRLGPAISPLVRLLKSKSANARNTVNEMLRHNFFLGKNKKEVTDVNGNVRTEYEESTIPVEVENTRTMQSSAAKYLRTIDENYKAMKKTGVAMKKVEFQKEIGKAMRRGDVHDIPEVAAAAKKIREEVITPITKGYQQLGELPENLNTKFALSYLPRVYDTKNIQDNMDDWLELLTVHFTGKDRGALEARQIAEDITDNILQSPTGRLPRLRVGEAAHMKERVINIPDDVLQKAGFLVDNVDDVMQKYLRSVVPELHLKQRFGDHELTGQIQNVKDEYTQLIDAAKTNKAREALRKQRDKDVEDIAAMRDIMLGRYLQPEGAAKKLTNFGRAVRQLSFMANLGMMTISAIPDIARPIMQHGAVAFAKALPRAMLGFAKTAKLAKRDLHDMGIGVEGVLQSRAYQLADIEDYGVALDKFTKTFAKYSGMNTWNGFWKQVAAFTAQNRFINDARKYDSLSPARKERLAKAGINKSMAKEIAKQAEEHGEKLAGGWHANTNAWKAADEADEVGNAKARHAADTFERVLLKDVDNTIITVGHGDRPLFMSTELGKTMLQFKTFFLAAHNQTFLPMLQQMSRGDRSAFQGLMAGIGLGMVAEWTRLHLSGRGDEFQNYQIQDWARAGLDRSGISTVPMELVNMADRLLDGGLSQRMGLMQGSRYFYRDWFGTVLGPTASYISDTGTTIQNLINDDGISARDIHSIRRLMPYQNMFYLRLGINQMEEAVIKATGAKPRKRRRGNTTETRIK